MDSEPQTNREIAIYFKEMKEDIKDIKDDVKEIKTQTQRTNGRVNKLEFWRSALIWGFGAMIGLIAFLIPYFTILIKAQIELVVTQSVNSSLSSFNINVTK